MPLFKLQIHKIQDGNKVCMEEILGRLCIYRTLQPDSLEAMRDKYIVEILHAAIMNETDKKITMRSQYGLVGEEGKSWVDFTVRVK